MPHACRNPTDEDLKGSYMKYGSPRMLVVQSAASGYACRILHGESLRSSVFTHKTNEELGGCPCSRCTELVVASGTLNMAVLLPP